MHLYTVVAVQKVEIHGALPSTIQQNAVMMVVTAL
jgi:hypothetical protein